MMKKSKQILSFKLILSLLFSLVLTQSALANEQNRVALVIGNGDYDIAPLKNPTNDASDMARALRNLGFDVDKRINANKKQMKSALRAFGKKLRESDTVGLFYYAGHGVQVNNRNYLIPIGADIDGESEVEYEAIDAGRILGKMEQAGNHLNLVILDACRDNPFGGSFRSLSRGLTRMQLPTGSMILYAASPGEKAADGNGRNGIFTQNLLKQMQRPGLNVDQVFKQTVESVYNNTSSQQRPYREGSIIGDFFFVEGQGDDLPDPVQVASADPSIASKAESEFWQDVKKDNTIESYETYLEEYSNGFYAKNAKYRLKKLKKPRQVAIETGKLTIRSNVSGDHVTLNGKSYGNTRLDLTLPSGEYELVISKSGYEDYTETVQISSGSHQTIRGHLSREGGDLSAYGIDMVSIPGGRFQMGSPSSEEGRDDDEKQHSVYVNNFKINRTEVTLKAFKQFISATGYKTDAEKNIGGVDGCWARKNDKGEWKYVAGYNYKKTGFSQSNNHPVVCVSHNDAMSYIKWLNRTTSSVFRLPTEAELEYAVRGGKSRVRFWSNGVDSKACLYANIADTEYWSNGFPCKDGYKYTSPVGIYRSNAYGLKDIAGNVWEWSCSSYSKSYDGSEKRCSDSADVFSLRGGAWDNGPNWVRSANRHRYDAFTRYVSVGFRLVQVD